MSGKAAITHLTIRMQEILLQLSSSRHIGNSLVTRANIILMAFQKEDNQTIAEAFRQRLNQLAGFEHVPKPIPMRNSRNAVVYYLFFASQKPVAQSIVEDVFKKYQNRRV